MLFKHPWFAMGVLGKQNSRQKILASAVFFFRISIISDKKTVI